MSMPDIDTVLNARMDPDDNHPGGITVQDCLLDLLSMVWNETDCFNGKRPWGESGWENDFYAALGRAELIHATFDEDGYLDKCDEKFGDKLIRQAIESLGDH